MERSATEPAKKRSRFGDAPPAMAAPEAPKSEGLSAIERAKAIAERLSANLPTGTSSAPSTSIQVRKKVYIPVEENPDTNFIGLLIGPNGQTHKDIQQKSGAKISIRGRGSSQKGGGNEPEEDDKLHVLIVGEREDQVRTAETMVRDILFDPSRAANLKINQLRALSSGGPMDGRPGLGAPQDPNEKSIHMDIPNRAVGKVIGKGGATIQDLEKRSRAQIKIQKEDDNNRDAIHTCILRGRQEDIDYAKQLIEDIIHEADNRGPPPGEGGHYGPSRGGEFENFIKVPHDRVGILIGSGGSTIRALSEKTGATIQIAKQDAHFDPNNPGFRECHITGKDQYCVDFATAEVERLVFRKPIPDKFIDPNSLMKIPKEYVGLLVGKGGSTIKMLKHTTNTEINVPNELDPGSNPPTKTFTISGSPDNVALAKRRIQEMMDNHREHGGGGGGGYGGGYGYGGQYQQQGQYQQGYQQQQGWDMQQRMGAGGNNANGQYQQYWQQYYAQQGQQQPGQQNFQQPGAPQQQQQPGQQPPGPPGQQQPPGQPGQQPQQAGQQPQQQAQGQMMSQANYTKEQWDAWRAYYAQMGYQLPEYEVNK